MHEGADDFGLGQDQHGFEDPHTISEDSYHHPTAATGREPTSPIAHPDPFPPATDDTSRQDDPPPVLAQRTLIQVHDPPPPANGEGTINPSLLMHSLGPPLVAYSDSEDEAEEPPRAAPALQIQASEEQPVESDVVYVTQAMSAPAPKKSNTRKKAKPGPRADRVQWPLSSDETFCHHCRRRSFKQSTACVSCTRRYCVRCVEVK